MILLSAVLVMLTRAKLLPTKSLSSKELLYPNLFYQCLVSGVVLLKLMRGATVKRSALIMCNGKYHYFMNRCNDELSMI